MSILLDCQCNIGTWLYNLDNLLVIKLNIVFHYLYSPWILIGKGDNSSCQWKLNYREFYRFYTINVGYVASEFYCKFIDDLDSWSSYTIGESFLYRRQMHLLLSGDNETRLIVTKVDRTPSWLKQMKIHCANSQST